MTNAECELTDSRTKISDTSSITVGCLLDGSVLAQRVWHWTCNLVVVVRRFTDINPPDNNPPDRNPPDANPLGQ